MFVRRLIATALLLVSVSPGKAADADQKWLCVVDAATGFAVHNGHWDQTNFRVTDEKYIIAKDERFNGKYSVKKLGYDGIGSPCEDLNDGETMSCDLINHWRFNFKTLRFLHFYP